MPGPDPPGPDPRGPDPRGSDPTGRSSEKSRDSNEKNQHFVYFSLSNVELRKWVEGKNANEEQNNERKRQEESCGGGGGVKGVGQGPEKEKEVSGVVDGLGKRWS